MPNAPKASPTCGWRYSWATKDCGKPTAWWFFASDCGGRTVPLCAEHAGEVRADMHPYVPPAEPTPQEWDGPGSPSHRLKWLFTELAARFPGLSGYEAAPPEAHYVAEVYALQAKLDAAEQRLAKYDALAVRAKALIGRSNCPCTDCSVLRDISKLAPDVPSGTEGT